MDAEIKHYRELERFIIDKERDLWEQFTVLNNDRFKNKIKEESEAIKMTKARWYQYHSLIEEFNLKYMPLE